MKINEKLDFIVVNIFIKLVWWKCDSDCLFFICTLFRFHTLIIITHFNQKKQIQLNLYSQCHNHPKIHLACNYSLSL